MVSYSLRLCFGLLEGLAIIITANTYLPFLHKFAFAARGKFDKSKNLIIARKLLVKLVGGLGQSFKAAIIGLAVSGVG